MKFVTQKGRIRLYLGTKFGWSMISSQGVISDYSRNMTPICCHAYRVNQLWEEAKNQYVDRLTSSLVWFERNRGKDYEDTVIV